MGKNQHVTEHERGWAVTAEGERSPSGVFKTQEAAWEKAKAIARRERADAVLHGRDGAVRARSGYRRDTPR
jgi:hypothetical protein